MTTALLAQIQTQQLIPVRERGVIFVQPSLVGMLYKGCIKKPLYRRNHCSNLTLVFSTFFVYEVFGN